MPLTQPLTVDQGIEARYELMRFGILEIEMLNLDDKNLKSLYEKIKNSKFKKNKIEVQRKAIDLFFKRFIDPTAYSNPNVIREAIKKTGFSSRNHFFTLLQDWVDLHVYTGGGEEIRPYTIGVLPSDKEIKDSYKYLTEKITNGKRQIKALEALYECCIVANRNTKVLWAEVDGLHNVEFSPTMSHIFRTSTSLNTSAGVFPVANAYENRIEKHADTGIILAESHFRHVPETIPTANLYLSKVEEDNALPQAVLSKTSLPEHLEQYDSNKSLSAAKAIINECPEDDLQNLKKALEKFKSYFHKVSPTGIQEVLKMIDSDQPTAEILITLRDVAKHRAQPNFFRTRSAETIEAYKVINQFFSKNNHGNEPKTLPNLIQHINDAADIKSNRPSPTVR